MLEVMKRSIMLLSLSLILSGSVAFGQRNQITPPSGKKLNEAFQTIKGKEAKDKVEQIDLLDDKNKKIQEEMKRKEAEDLKRMEEEKKTRLDKLEKERVALLKEIEEADSKRNREYRDLTLEEQEAKNDAQDYECLRLRSEYEAIDLEIDELTR